MLCVQVELDTTCGESMVEVLGALVFSDWVS